MAKDTGKHVGVVDQSGIVMPYLVDTEDIDYTDYSTQLPDSVKASFKDLGLDALVVVSPIDHENRTVSVVSYSSKPMSMDMKETITAKVDNAVEDYRISLYDMGDLKGIMESIESDI